MAGPKGSGGLALEGCQVDLNGREDLPELVVQLDGQSPPLLLLRAKEPPRQRFQLLTAGAHRLVEAAPLDGRGNAVRDNLQQMKVALGKAYTGRGDAHEADRLPFDEERRAHGGTERHVQR